VAGAIQNKKVNFRQALLLTLKTLVTRSFTMRKGEGIGAYVNLKDVCTVRFFSLAEHWLIKTFIFSILDVAV
jgi:hypothetical protein